MPVRKYRYCKRASAIRAEVSSAVPTFCHEITHKPARRKQIVFRELANSKVSKVCFL